LRDPFLQFLGTFPASGQTNRAHENQIESTDVPELKLRSNAFFSAFDRTAVRSHKLSGLYIYAQRVLSRAQFFHDFAAAEPSKIL
jgi:hypothetical protein